MEENSGIIKELGEIIEYLHQQKTKQAYDILNLTIGKLVNIIQTIEASNNTAESIENFNKVLLQCVEAMEDQDSVLLADLLEYEVITILNNWNVV